MMACEARRPLLTEMFISQIMYMNYDCLFSFYSHKNSHKNWGG